MVKQKKFTNDKGDFNGVTNISESESLFLPKIEKGVKSLDEGFETIYDYDILNPLIKKARRNFLRDIEKNINQNDIKKINSGLKDYVQSSTRFSYNLMLLKASIINAFGEERLTASYKSSDDETHQMIPISYFENLEDLISIDSSWLIDSKSIEYYSKRATYYTKNVLKKFIYKIEEDEENFYLYRGQGNHKYYKSSKKDNKPDLISYYTGCDEIAFSYFERQILNSYSINERVAEKFMIQQRNTRRSFLTADFNAVVNNVFSSFIVSDIFVEGQYELLCLPSLDDLFITEDVNDELCAEFHIRKTTEKPNKLFRKKFVNGDYEAEEDDDT